MQRTLRRLSIGMQFLAQYLWEVVESKTVHDHTACLVRDETVQRKWVWYVVALDAIVPEPMALLDWTAVEDLRRPHEASVPRLKVAVTISTSLQRHL